MPQQVSLSESDRDCLIDVTQLIVDWKWRALSEPNWQRFEQQYLPKLIEQLNDNLFTINNTKNSTFTWLIDQIEHSCLYSEGIPLKYCPPLKSSKIAKRAIDICKAATLGPLQYQQYQESLTNL